MDGEKFYLVQSDGTEKNSVLPSSTSLRRVKMPPEYESGMNAQLWSEEAVGAAEEQQGQRNADPETHYEVVKKNTLCVSHRHSAACFGVFIFSA